jgi:protein-S-isoprenylcysteine O-methyltransferase Ste14
MALLSKLHNGLGLVEIALELMTTIEKADWYFILPATIIWVLSLVTTAWDFILLQGMMYHFDIESGLGLPLLLGGISLRALGRRTLKKNYSYVLESSRKKELITYGVYRFVRHPIYLASMLYVLGLPLIFSSAYGFVVTLGFIPCILYRIRVEERMLIQEFGEEYLEYKKHTKKLIPHVY